MLCISELKLNMSKFFIMNKNKILYPSGLYKYGIYGNLELFILSVYSFDFNLYLSINYFAQFIYTHSIQLM
jgi:hypothetical protein